MRAHVQKLIKVDENFEVGQNVDGKVGGGTWGHDARGCAGG